MLSRSAITKLKAILVIDMIIVASATGVYFYLQSQGLIAYAPKPAEFTVTDLTFNTLEAEVFEPIVIRVNLTNLGDLEGTYMANLTINNKPEDNQTIVLPGRNSTIVEFTLVKEVAGTYAVELGGLSGSFNLKPPSQTSSNIGLSKLVVTPYEAWANQTITASVTATNIGTETENFTLRLMIDDALVDAKKIGLVPGETVTVDFTFNATTEGRHTLKVNSLSGSFTIVRTGYHTLTINRSGGGSTPLPFTLNGVAHNTAYTELLPVGEYTLSVPNPFTTATAVLEFAYWQDGVTTPSRTINLQNRLIIVATYNLISGYASCPSLYFWNGTNYVYATDIANSGWLGYIDHINEKGSIIFGGGNPWDYVKLDKNQLAPRNTGDNSYYDLVLFQQWDELFYLDTAYMLIVDHTAGTDVYSTMSNYVNRGFSGQIYTVSKNNLSAPISATNEKGEDVLPQILQVDRVFTPGINGLLSPSWDNISLNQLTLDLGDLSGAQQIKLTVNGMVDWGSPEPYYDWINGFQTAFAEGLVPSGTQVYPSPSMEVKDASGNWVRVPQDRQIPTPSDFTSRSFVVDLTGLFPADVVDYQIRITNFFNVTFDYIGVDTSPQENTKVTEIYPTATLNPLDFGDITSTALGNFTRYGDVTPLILRADDMFVIGMQGDSVSLRFPTGNLPPLEDGMERDFFLFVAAWFKDPPGNWGYGFDYTVEPLPFMNMSGFPYSLNTESSPFDAEHLTYLSQWNTRIVTPL
jgi:hypothetical protein